MVVIGIGGEKEVGKDTAAEALMKEFGFQRFAFADPLKEMCAIAFGIELYTLHDQALKEKPFETPLVVGTTHIQRLIDESDRRGIAVQPDEASRLTASLAGKTFTNARQILQYVGTEGMRQSIRDDYWLELFKQSLAGVQNVIVTDMRFPNERDLIRSLDGYLVRIKRPGKGASTHASENSLGGDDEYSLVANNNESIDDLQSKMITWWKDASLQLRSSNR